MPILDEVEAWKGAMRHLISRLNPRELAESSTTNSQPPVAKRELCEQEVKIVGSKTAARKHAGAARGRYHSTESHIVEKAFEKFSLK